jgi:hypothetical protein
VANGSGKPAGLTVTVQDAQTGASHGSGRLSLPASLSWSHWHDVSVPLHLDDGSNLVTLSVGAGDNGGPNVDSLTIA